MVTIARGTHRPGRERDTRRPDFPDGSGSALDYAAKDIRAKFPRPADLRRFSPAPRDRQDGAGNGG